MIPVLRLTTMLLWMPSAAAFALQVTPRPAPRPKVERPRIVEPRVEKPFNGWHDFELFSRTSTTTCRSSSRKCSSSTTRCSSSITS